MLQRVLNNEEMIAILYAKRLGKVPKDLEKLKLRKRHIRVVYFNLNFFSTEESLRPFRFKRKEIQTIANAFHGVI